MKARDDQPGNDNFPPSMTAMQVAQAYYSSPVFNQLANSDAKKLIKYLVAWAKHAYPFKSKWQTQLFDTLPIPVVKGIHGFFKAKNYPGFIATRKAYIAQAVDQAILDGVEQVLVIGGGFDVMALMKHHHHPDVEFYELDRGPHQKMKQQALHDLREETYPHADLQPLAVGLQKYAMLNVNMHFLEADLGEPGWESRLFDHGFNADKKTICVGEGLTMYLSNAETVALLASLTKILQEDSRLILSFIDPIEKSCSEKIRNHVLSETNETYKMRLAIDEVPEFMHQNGFSVMESLSRIEIQKSLGLSESNMKKSVGLSENYYLSKPNHPGATLQPVSSYKL